MVRIAPLSIPLERRIQTLTVLLWVFTQLLCIFASFVLFFSPLILVMLGYLVWIWYDEAPKHGGRPSQWFKRLNWWCYLRDFFPCHLHKTHDLDASKSYVFGYHPHGVIALGAFINFATEATGFSTLFPGIKCHLTTLTTNFKIPFFREYLMALGMCDVSEQSCKNVLTKQMGESVMIVVGGAAEALDARAGSYKLTLKRRKGFCRIALEKGASLVPVFSFGENDLFDQVENPKGSRLRQIQNWFQSVVGFSFPLVHGRGIFLYDYGILPFRKTIHTVVGKPIPVEKVENPTKEQIMELHSKYAEALNILYEENKKLYEPALNAQLELSD